MYICIKEIDFFFSNEKGRSKDLLWLKSGTERQMHPREVENVLVNEAQGFPDPCPVVQLNHHFTFWALLIFDCRNVKAGTVSYHIMLNRKKKKPPLSFMPFSSTKLQWFCRLPSVLLLRISLTGFGRARVKKHFRNKNLHCFREFVAAHEITTLAQGQVKLCVVHALF